MRSGKTFGLYNVIVYIVLFIGLFCWRDIMKIIKIFNNNAVATISDNKNDLILTGSGIGFQKKIGDGLMKTVLRNAMYMKVEKKMQCINYSYVHLRNILSFLNPLWEKAMEELNISFQDQTIIALTDHICFAVEQYETATELPNLVLDEIKTLYKEEFKIGLWSVKYINQELKIDLPIDEAGYIAMHIINGANNTNSNSTMKMIQLVDGCVSVISDSLGIYFDKDSLDYTRLVTHLKFMAQRIFSGIHEEEGFGDKEMISFLSNKDTKILTCITAIRNYISSTFSYELSEKELLYLMIHIYKIINLMDCY